MPPRKSDAGRKSDVAVRPAPKPAAESGATEEPSQIEPPTPSTAEKRDKEGSKEGKEPKEGKELKEGVSIDVRSCPLGHNSPRRSLIETLETNTDFRTLQDLNLPKSIITRLAKGVLPQNIQLQANAVLALRQSATVFISYLASQFVFPSPFPPPTQRSVCAASRIIPCR